MANKADRLVADRSPAAGAGLTLSTTASTVSGVLLANTTYRFHTTADCYLRIADDNTAADSSDMYLPSGAPEIFVTTGNKIVVNALRVTGDGVLNITPMYSRGE